MCTGDIKTFIIAFFVIVKFGNNKNVIDAQLVADKQIVVNIW